MPAKKAAAKKKKKTSVSKKKPARASRAPGRGRVSKKKSAAKRASKKKTAKSAGTSRKKTSKKATRKVSKKKAAPKKTSKKKTVRTKKAGAKKRSSKKTGGKKAAPKSTTTKKTSRKKVGSKKHVSTKKAGAPSKKKPLAATKSTAGKKPPAARSSSARRESVLAGPVRGFTPYQPKRGEEYMSDAQLGHFRHILIAWKRELMEEVDRTMHHMKDDAANFPDPNDRATQESEFGLELRTRDRERKLLRKIDSALQRIEDGSYGYCEETGEEIGLRRLEARPVATLCVEAQERRELAERQFRDREDYYR